ncbi:MAG: 16S rRNA (cytidine(1402)-2'-O)-methyltransferase [Gammaproteobacteria bacterium]|jgi:16S rRNA (cytidine1402-2'-O)-methyltransferase|nr:16S rRNA (cytidine(1402)-2'-O)-methyltransferase [Gammaproteobacteria bacterium]
MQQEIGKLYVVATPIGNLDDISQRARDVLSHVTWIAAEDTRHSRVLLEHLGITTPLVSYHEHNERPRTDELIEKIRQGENGALISDAGTPLISDPGYILVAGAHDAGIQVVPIPGACSIIAALSVAGVPTDKFLFEGFLPAKAQARRQRLSKLATFPHTMVFFEAPHRLTSLLADCAEILTPLRQATLAREITKKFESIYRDQLGGLLERAENGEIVSKGECVLVIQGLSRQEESETSHEEEMQRVLNILLPEVSLKQAVQIAMKLTGFAKNALYDCATKLQKKSEL